jgi:hypothetical protein
MSEDAANVARAVEVMRAAFARQAKLASPRSLRADALTIRLREVAAIGHDVPGLLLEAAARIELEWAEVEAWKANAERAEYINEFGRDNATLRAEVERLTSERDHHRETLRAVRGGVTRHGTMILEDREAWLFEGGDDD